MKYSFVLPVVALAMLAGSMAGCGGGDDEIRAPLHGKVTYQGNPVTKGRVNFSNVPQGVHLTAAITESGTYEVRTYRGVGIPPGTYQVTVLPPAENPDNKFAPPPECPDIPAKYRNPATSNLSCTVVKGKDNQYNITMIDR